jgi:ribosomal-protein-alanine N-acetyltransferase
VQIVTENIVLRPWVISDATQLSLIANNKSIADNLRDGFPFPYSLKDAEKWLGMVLSENNPPRFFAITLEYLVIGSIGIVAKSDIYRKNFEIGYFLSEKYWGRGIITKTIRAATSYAFKEFDVIRIYAEPFSDNIGSRRALEKAGFTLEAILRKNVIKNGVIKDSCIYSLLKEKLTF